MIRLDKLTSDMFNYMNFALGIIAEIQVEFRTRTFADLKESQDVHLQ